MSSTGVEIALIVVHCANVSVGIVSLFLVIYLLTRKSAARDLIFEYKIDRNCVVATYIVANIALFIEIFTFSRAVHTHYAVLHVASGLCRFVPSTCLYLHTAQIVLYALYGGLRLANLIMVASTVYHAGWTKIRKLALHLFFLIMAIAYFAKSITITFHFRHMHSFNETFFEFPELVFGTSILTEDRIVSLTPLSIWIISCTVAGTITCKLDFDDRKAVANNIPFGGMSKAKRKFVNVMCIETIISTCLVVSAFLLHEFFDRFHYENATVGRLMRNAFLILPAIAGVYGFYKYLRIESGITIPQNISIPPSVRRQDPLAQRVPAVQFHDLESRRDRIYVI